MNDVDISAVLARLGFSTTALIVFAVIALLLSSYVKIVTVLGIVRAGIGLNGIPSALVTGGLACVLAFFVMYPTLRESAAAMDGAVKSGAVVSDADRATALNSGLEVWKRFLKSHAGKQETERFSLMASKLDARSGGNPAAAAPADPGIRDRWQVLAPAFFVTELKGAFVTGLSLFLPFLVIDLLVSTVLTAVGYGALNPYLVALPLKLLLFAAVDGWSLITTNLVASYLG